MESLEKDVNEGDLGIKNLFLGVTLKLPGDLLAH
jgi:hypothetical protein